MDKQYVPQALVILMFCTSVAAGVGYAMKSGLLLDVVFWWIAASINAHSFITLASRR
jgi:hypothetical protein